MDVEVDLSVKGRKLAEGLYIVTVLTKAQFHYYVFHS
jgi:hypothetical protein